MEDLGIETSDVLLPTQPLTIKLKLNAADLELAFATRGNSLRVRIMMAIVQKLIASEPEPKEVH